MVESTISRKGRTKHSKCLHCGCCTVHGQCKVVKLGGCQCEARSFTYFEDAELALQSDHVLNKVQGQGFTVKLKWMPADKLWIVRLVKEVPRG